MGLVDDSGHGGEKPEESGVLCWLVGGRHQRGQHPPYAGQHWIAGARAFVGPSYCGAEYPRDRPLGASATEGVDQQRVRPRHPGERGEITDDTTQRLAEHTQRPLDQPGAGSVLAQQRCEG